MELRSVIDRHMEQQPETSQSKKKKGNKPVIRSVERIEMEIPKTTKKEVTWAQVAKTKTRNINKNVNIQGRQKPILMENTQTQVKRTRSMAIKNLIKLLEKKANKTAAISITTREDITQKEFMIRAKREINLKELGIETCHTRSGFTGGIIIEIPGEDAERKADISGTIARAIPREWKRKGKSSEEESRYQDNRPRRIDHKRGGAGSNGGDWRMPSNGDKSERHSKNRSRRWNCVDPVPG